VKHPGGGSPADHDPNCGWEKGGYPCRKWSTDGTRLGADIAHTMRTADETEIAAGDQDRLDEGIGIGAARRALTGMAEEQADWDAIDW
jgi:hypothetical protein